MDDNENKFVWTPELCTRLFELRFEHDWLFKTTKQPWSAFYKLLLVNGFPSDMTINHVRKKWSYTYDMYKLAKKTNNKSWPFWKMFDKHFNKSCILDKFDSWDDEWRLKFIICISEAKDMKLDSDTMWRTVERAMRCQDMPIDCCVQDMKGLWQHIRTTFNRKYRLTLKKGGELSEWPLYDAMLTYYQKFEPEHLINLENLPTNYVTIMKTNKDLKNKQTNKINDDDDNENEFQWSRDITETFIQIRLQNDWLFRQKKWVWPEFQRIMVDEYGFPKTLSSREISRKWSATYAEYQKAKATNNKSWLYYSLFELYLAESSLSINPLHDWQEEWVFNLISSRTDLDFKFKYGKEEYLGWREVEKRLRILGLPLDHSLFDVADIWKHLLKTLKWKQKFANKGILSEHWPYFEAMMNYTEKKQKPTKMPKLENKINYDDITNDDVTNDDVTNDDMQIEDFEDDIKLIDLKEKLCVKPKMELELLYRCRSCSNDVADSVDIFEEKDKDGLDVACKLRVICGVQVEESDNYPKHICNRCLQELENAYKFRRKCQEVDKQYRETALAIKVEVQDKQELKKDESDVDIDTHDLAYEPNYSDNEQQTKRKLKPQKMKVKKKNQRKLRYYYWKVCEICGKHTRNLMNHLDTHSTDKVHSCDICDKKFKFKSGLNIHKAIHNPTPRKTCEVCGKSFHILAAYRKHFVYHANERKFGCEMCGKRFNSMDILRVHTRIHTDERPFSCNECGKTFRTAGCVSRHKRIVHKNIRKS